MKAYLQREAGPQARLELGEVPKPAPGDNEVLVQVKASSVNPVDNKILRAPQGFSPAFPAVLHGDVSGIVAQVGAKVTKFNVGDEVYGCIGGVATRQGALAEFIPAFESQLALKPKNLSFTEAAALPLVVITAWDALIDRCGIKEGESVLVHAGAGGVGHIAIQIAANKGAKVTTTISSDEKAAIAKGFGATEAVNYRNEQVEEYKQRVTGGAGFNVVFDTLGDLDNTFGKSIELAAYHGPVASIVATAPYAMLPAFVKGLSLHFVLMLLPIITGQGMARHGEILAEAAALAEAGKLKPLIEKQTFKFSQINEAHALFESGKFTGKIVLEADF